MDPPMHLSPFFRKNLMCCSCRFKKRVPSYDSLALHGMMAHKPTVWTLIKAEAHRTSDSNFKSTSVSAQRPDSTCSSDSCRQRHKKQKVRPRGAPPPGKRSSTLSELQRPHLKQWPDVDLQAVQPAWSEVSGGYADHQVRVATVGRRLVADADVTCLRLSELQSSTMDRFSPISAVLQNELVSTCSTQQLGLVALAKFGGLVHATEMCRSQSQNCVISKISFASLT